MRAAWATGVGPPSTVRVVDRPDPRPGPGQALVSIGAASVNFPDVLLLAGRYQMPARFPYTPGSEFAGVVTEVGAGVDPALVGRRVMGAGFDGAFAEQVAVPVDALRPTPNGMDDAHAAAFAVAYRTAYHALVTVGGGRAGETVVVLGAAGGVGLAAVEVAARLGLRVIAAASSAIRLELARQRGAAEGINYAGEDLKERIKQMTDGGADLIIDPVGGPYAELSLRATRWGGRFVSVGFASGEIPRIPLNLVLLKGVIVRGFEIRTLAQHDPDGVMGGEHRLAELVAAGLRPHVSATFPLDQVATALDRVAQRQAAGKIVILP